MFDRKKIVFTALALFLLALSSFSQSKPADGTVLQRLDVMRDKLDRMKRSLTSVESVLRDENKSDASKKDDKDNPGTPLGRIVALGKDVSRLQSDVNNLRGKADRGEKYEVSDVDSVEQAVGELQARVEKAQLETASGRAT